MKSPRCNQNAQGAGGWGVGNCFEPRAPSPEHGFSLIELLIASVVIASVGSLLIGGLIAANRSANLRIEQTLATQLLANQLALMDDHLSQQTPTRGAWDTPAGEFTWTLEWTPTPLAPLAQATLTVAKQDHISRVVTYRPLAEPQ